MQQNEPFLPENLHSCEGKPCDCSDQLQGVQSHEKSLFGTFSRLFRHFFRTPGRQARDDLLETCSAFWAWEGDATKHFSVKKRVFSERGGGNSVNQGFGKNFYRKGNSVKRFGPFTESQDSENWKVAVLIPFPKISSYQMTPVNGQRDLNTRI